MSGASLRSVLGAAARRAAAQKRAGRGESPRPARPGSDLLPPGGRAGTHRAACPLVRHVLPAPGSMSVAGTWQDRVFPSGFLLISWRGGEKTGERSRLVVFM